LWNLLRPTRKKLVVSPADFSRLKPLRNPLVDWKRTGEHDVEIVIDRPKSARADLLAKIFVIPEKKKYKLDEIGSTVWTLCDGEHTCKEIVERLCMKYKYLRREAELSLLSYM